MPHLVFVGDRNLFFFLIRKHLKVTSDRLESIFKQSQWLIILSIQEFFKWQEENLLYSRQSSRAESESNVAAHSLCGKHRARGFHWLCS